MRNRREPLFADHMLLELALFFNLAHFAVMLVLSVLDHRDYRYFALAFTSAGGVWDFLKFLALFLMPSILAVAFALVLSAVSGKPAWVRKPLTALAAVSILGFMGYAVLLSSVFTSMMPFASHTAKPENFGKYDKTVMENVPTSNCPVSITEIPAGAENFRYSYTYVSTVDFEWTVEASYTMPQAAYQAQKAAMRSAMTAACTPVAAGTGYSTDGWLDVFGKAKTQLDFSFDDGSRTLLYHFRAFIPS